jgi:hypothetical protein
MTGIARSSLVRWFSAFTLGGLVVASGLGRAQGQWVTFQSSGAQFSIEMPQQPRTTKMTTSSFIGDVTDDLFTATETNGRFTVDYSRIPRFALDFAGAGTIYDHAKGALLKQTWSKPISFEDITTAEGQTGKRLVYQTPPVPGKPKFYGEAHFFLVGDRFYAVDATVPAGDSEADAKRFLASIRFQ